MNDDDCGESVINNISNLERNSNYDSGKQDVNDDDGPPKLIKEHDYHVEQQVGNSISSTCIINKDESEEEADMDMDYDKLSQSAVLSEGESEHNSTYTDLSNSRWSDFADSYPSQSVVNGANLLSLPPAESKCPRSTSDYCLRQDDDGINYLAQNRNLESNRDRFLSHQYPIPAKMRRLTESDGRRKGTTANFNYMAQFNKKSSSANGIFKNIYKLTQDKIIRYRNMLLTRLSIKELRQVLDEADAHEASLSEREKAERSERPIYDQIISPRGSRSMSNVRGVGRVNMGGSISRTTVTFPFAGLQIGRFRVVAPDVTTPNTMNSVRLDKITQKIYYDFTCNISNQLLHAIYAVSFDSILAIYINRNDVYLKLKSAATMVPSPNGNMLDISQGECSVALLQLISLRNKVDEFKRILISFDPLRFTNIFVDYPYFFKTYVESDADKDENEGEVIKTQEDAIMNWHRVNDIQQNIFNPMPSYYQQHEYMSDVNNLYHGIDVRLMAPHSSHFSFSPFDSYDNGGIRPSDDPTNSPNPIFSQYPGSALQSMYASEECRHDSQYAHPPAVPPPIIQSQYIVSTLREHVYCGVNLAMQHHDYLPNYMQMDGNGEYNQQNRIQRNGRINEMEEDNTTTEHSAGGIVDATDQSFFEASQVGHKSSTDSSCQVWGEGQSELSHIS